MGDGKEREAARRGVTDHLAGIFDRLEHGWENRRTVKGIGNVLIAVFLVELALIYAARNGLLPDFLEPYVPRAIPSTR